MPPPSTMPISIQRDTMCGIRHGGMGGSIFCAFSDSSLLTTLRAGPAARLLPSGGFGVA